MFQQYKNIQMELHYLWRGHFGPFRKLLPLVPKSTQERLHERFGWNLFIRGTK